MRKIGFIFFLWIIGFQLYAQQNVVVKAEMDTLKIRIGEQAKLRLSAVLPSGKEIQFPVLKDTLQKDVEIVGEAKLDTLFDEADLTKHTITHTYFITSFDSGYYAIRPFQFVFDNDTLETNPLLLEVTTVEVDTTLAIKDIKGPIEVEYTFMDWLKDNLQWISVGVAILALLLLIVRYLQKREKKPEVQGETIVIVPAHIEALEKLKEIDEAKIWQAGDVKTYYTSLSDVLRQYLEKRFQVSLMELTTDEVMQMIRMKPIEISDRESLNELLKLADLVKFAKEKPVGFENEQSMKIAVQFVENTKLKEAK